MARFTGAILDLNQDKIDAVIVGDIVAKPYLENNPKLEKAAVVDEHADGSAIAVKKGNEQLVEDLNVEIQKLKDSGKYYELVEKHFAK